MRLGWWAALLCVAAMTIHAAEPTGAQAGATSELRDPDFGVTTSAPGLRRRVEMLQWQPVADGYAMVWDEASAASGGHPREYRNPAPQTQARTWLAERLLIEGKPLAPGVLRKFGTWRAFRPSFSALPGPSGRRFQPEGDGLGTAENPLDPQVGDLRVTWEAMHLPPLAGRLVVHDGSWQLRRTDPRSEPPAEAPATPWALRPRVVAVLGATLLVALLLASFLRRRR